MMVMGQIGAGVLEVAKRCPSAFPFFLNILPTRREKEKKKRERQDTRTPRTPCFVEKSKEKKKGIASRLEKTNSRRG